MKRREKYKVITLCGSTKFKAQYERVNERLTLLGNIVISVGVFGMSGKVLPHQGQDDNTKVKEKLDKIHLSKIDMADEIFVINVAGYIGESTANEIKYALSKNIRVRYLCNPYACFGDRRPHPMDFEDQDEYRERLANYNKWEQHKLF